METTPVLKSPPCGSGARLPFEVFHNCGKKCGKSTSFVIRQRCPCWNFGTSTLRFTYFLAFSVFFVLLRRVGGPSGPVGHTPVPSH